MSKLFLALGMLLALGAAGCRESAEKSSSSTEQSTSAKVTTPAPAASTTSATPAAPALPGLPGTGKVHKLASGLQCGEHGRDRCEPRVLVAHACPESTTARRELPRAAGTARDVTSRRAARRRR